MFFDSGKLAVVRVVQSVPDVTGLALLPDGIDQLAAEGHRGEILDVIEATRSDDPGAVFETEKDQYPLRLQDAGDDAQSGPDVAGDLSHGFGIQRALGTFRCLPVSLHHLPPQALKNRKVPEF